LIALIWFTRRPQRLASAPAETAGAH